MYIYISSDLYVSELKVMMEEKREVVLTSDATFMPHGKFGDDKELKMQSFSFDRRMDTSRGGTVIRKTKSLNAQLLINIDELIDNSAANCRNIDSNINPSSGNEIRYSLSLTAPALLSHQLSDVLRLPSPKRSK